MKAKIKRVLVLFSGGMDSLWLLASAMKERPECEVFALHFQYGQKTQSQEEKSFRECCDFYKIGEEKRRILNLNFLPQIAKSSLTSQDVKVNVSGIDSVSKTLPTSYVPFRNTIFLSLALAWAENENIKEVHIGAVSEDGHGYPDCRPEYYECFNELIHRGSREGNIKIITPLIAAKKEKIVGDLVNWKAPLDKTWSCYQSSGEACGKCDSCLLRLQAFESINKSDVIPYQK